MTPNPWKPSSPQKKSSGQGNYFGCIGKVFSHNAEIKHLVKKKGDVTHEPRNITTNPSKKVNRARVIMIMIAIPMIMIMTTTYP